MAGRSRADRDSPHGPGLQVRRRRLIRLQALASAFPPPPLVLLTLGPLDLVVPPPREDLSYRRVGLMMPIVCSVGLFAGQRRYP